MGKTYLAAGLCNDALKKGYKAYFRTMEQIMEMLKLKDITRSAGVEYKRLLKSHLLVIDDIMLFALDFNTVYKPYHQTRQNATTLLSS